MSRLRTAALEPMVAAAAARGMTPNQLTLSGLALAAAGGLLLALFPGYQLPLLLLPLIIAARLVMDMLDGMLARGHGLVSEEGALLNELAEALFAALLYLPVALHPAISGWLIVLVVVLGLCAEITGLAGLAIGAGRRDEGPFGKRDRAVLFAVIGLILGLDGDAAPWLPWLLVPALLLTVVTIANRMRAALRDGKGAQPILPRQQR